MSKFEIKRSAVLGAFVLTSIVVLNGALARPRAPFGGVRVDVASLRAEAGDPTARRVAGASARPHRGSGQRRRVAPPLRASTGYYPMAVKPSGMENGARAQGS
jgi:hypothetical protein